MQALIINCSPVKTGATAEIVRIVSEQLSIRYDVRSVCIDDYDIACCKGCRSCHATGECVQHDDVDELMDEFEKSDIIVAVSPSYWADVPGQFKVFSTDARLGAIRTSLIKSFLRESAAMRSPFARARA